MQTELTVIDEAVASVREPDFKPGLRTESAGGRRIQPSLPYLLIAVAVLLAWFPAITNYIGVNDDYLDFIILKNGWRGWFQVWGIWRIWGIPLSIWSVNWHPLAPVLLGLFAHALSLLLFYKVCELFFEHPVLSLTLVLLMGIFPWGYEAIVWAAAQSPVLAHTLFWANIIILIKYARKEPRQQKTAFIISFLLTLVGVLGNDYLIFSCMLSGVIVWIPEDKFGWPEIKRRMLSYYSGWAPLLASLCYVALFRYFSAEAVNDYKHPFFNVRSILSAYYYQYTNAWVFQPWLNPVTRRLMFFSWSWPQTIAVSALALLLAYMLWLFFRQHSLNERQSSRVNNSLLFYIILLLFGGSLVYAFNGGYSLDSRKKYPLIPLMLLLIGWAYRRFAPAASKLTTKSLVMLSVLIITGVTTTWLVIGVWRYEVARHAALVDYLSAHSVSGDIRLISDPDMYAAWPKLIDTIGFRLDDEWVLNNALEYKGAGHIKLSPAPSARLLRFDPNQMRWEEAPR